VIEWGAARIAAAAGASLVHEGRQTPGAAEAQGPRRVRIDSRGVQAGDLFVGLRGERVDGGSHAEQALAAGAWGVLVGSEHAARLTELDEGGTGTAPAGVVLEHRDPLVALQALARAWRLALGAKVVAITGSTGKTSTKDILAALLERELRTAASPENLNTEIGLPLAVLAAPAGTEALVLEMAMRGPGQIAELVAIAEPDVGVIVNIGPVHLELLGSLEAIAAAKAELIAGLAPAATIVVPAGEPLLSSHLRADLRTVTFGDGGDVELLCGPAEDQREEDVGGLLAAAGVEEHDLPDLASGEIAIIDHASGGATGRPIVMKPSFSQSHNLRNLLAAVAAARALGVTPSGELNVSFSALRGERVALADGIVLINDCYNANPMSMRAALDELAATAPARRVAVLGDMLELGSEQGPGLHREVAAYASARGVELLLAVGPLAAEMGETFSGELHEAPDAAAAAALLPGLLRTQDTVLVKGSRGVGLEVIAETLADADASAESPESAR
jgi:UDP-N-acetylmuramoyl-tripeptide--D-alanyl-D-alanine ligase